jgi:hypothetical protein
MFDGNVPPSMLMPVPPEPLFVLVTAPPPIGSVQLPLMH